MGGKTATTRHREKHRNTTPRARKAARPKGRRCGRQTGPTAGQETLIELEPAERDVITKAKLTLDEFARLTKQSPAYIVALLREGMFTEALVATPKGARITLAALPMFELVAEVAERVTAGALTLQQANYVLTEVRPRVPTL